MNWGAYLTYGIITLGFGGLMFVIGLMSQSELDNTTLNNLQGEIDHLTDDLVKTQRRANDFERRLNEEISGRIDFLIDINRALEAAENRKGE